MKHFLIFIFLFLSLTFAFPMVNQTQAIEYNLEEGEAFVISTKCSIYTQNSFSSEKITVDDSEFYLKNGDRVEILLLTGDFAYIKYSETIEGFVYKFYLTQNQSQSVYPVFNATIRKDTAVLDSDIILKAGSRVFLYKGFDNDNGYSAVQFVLENGDVINGYVLTEDINPDGVSGMLIAGITIIIASVTIILSLIFIKKRKK